ncbi:MAG: hypothetical protein JF887_02055 [Candidatus Dormibacteraeota bacterium]|uniref:Uncharacterized protein n=1 Tax=Candidatus Amunia macphersoniae TaxID=3127014 RepID=A0A934KLN4_9BACT|nr:hypothetical protein [Candidatus Dormibacteraeota bacterium]
MTGPLEPPPRASPAWGPPPPAAKGTLLSQTPGTYQGFPSADAVLSFPASRTISAGDEQLRIVLAGHTEFDVIADGPANPPKQFVQFAKSLKIITHAP